MELLVRPYLLHLAHRWTIASRKGPGGGSGTDTFPIILVRLRDADGIEGFGESAPSERYNETVATVEAFLARIDPSRLSFADPEGSRAYLQSLSGTDHAAKCALDIALADGAARRAGKPLHDYLGLGFTEGKHVTSFSIGLDKPDMIRVKVEEAREYPILKLKLGGRNDYESLMALRMVSPTKPVRLDANEAWKTKEKALKELEWLATDGGIQFVEQPMPASAPRADWEWLKEASPIPIMADESYRDVTDLPEVARCFHAVNVKLVKAGGVTPAMAALKAAREAGLKTMLGCMLESSVLIAAAAHLAELTDYLDLDGNLLVTNDPFHGLTAHRGVLSFARAHASWGLRVTRGATSPV